MAVVCIGRLSWLRYGCILQAEDGIRDVAVTGVQTCALPISPRSEKDYHFQTEEGPASLAGLFRGRSQLLVYHFMFGPDYRSEERRVGKECRSRWSPYH